jgi:hypothetical protein
MPMKGSNRRLQFFNAGLQMLNKLSLTKIQSSRAAKQLRQEKRAKRMWGWGFGGSGARECARRMRQMSNGMDCGQGNFL